MTETPFEIVAKEWVATDRLWTTSDTIERSLLLFARVILTLAAQEAAPASAPPEPEQEMKPVIDELRRRMRATLDYDLASKPALFDIGVMAMTAQSDPNASAEVYRKALIDICNYALKAQDALAAIPASAPLPAPHYLCGHVVPEFCVICKAKGCTVSQAPLPAPTAELP
jgi:hypothetical protein